MVKLSLWTHFYADFDCGNDDNFHVFCSAASAHCDSIGPVPQEHAPVFSYTVLDKNKQSQCPNWFL